MLFRLAARLEAAAKHPASITALVVALAIYGGVICTRRMGDFDVYHRAATRLVAGEDVYRLEDPHRYLYAPILVFLFVPLAPLPLVLGKVVWFLGNLWFAKRAVVLSLRLVFRAERAPPGLVCLLLLFTFRFLDNNIAHGQTNLFLLWLVLEAYALAGAGKAAMAGLALAGAIAVKPFAAILCLEIALRRDLRFLAGTVFGFVLLLAAPALWWGPAYPDVVRDWMTVVSDQVGHYETGNKINQSISAFTYRLFHHYPYGSPVVTLSEGAVSAITAALHAVFLTVLVRRSVRADRAGGLAAGGPAVQDLALYLTYATIALPYSWKYYFVNLLLPLTVLLARLHEGRSLWLLAGLACVFVLNFLPGFRLIGRQGALFFQLASFHFVAAAAVFVLVDRFGERLAGTFPSRRSVC